MIYDQIEKNTRNSILLIVLMTIFTVLVCWFVGDYFFNQGVVGLVIGVGIASISALSSYYAGDKIVLTSVRAKKANVDRHRVLMNVVKEMSLASGLPTPEVYVIPDNSPNAFATGRDPEHSSIAVTEGLLQALTREELQGVIAHEMSHVQNRDILFVTVVSIMVGAVVIISSVYRTSLWFGGTRGRRDNDSGGDIFALIGLLLIIFAPFASKIIQLAISRQREYLADSNAALLTRNPGALASALQKISTTHTKATFQNTAVNPLFISEPYLGVTSKEFFSTHPPIEKRIKRLNEMAYSRGDLVKGV